MKKLTHEEIQDCIFDIMVYLDNICRKHNIKYMLSSGTCLGAIRHKDFIPWDNDADVFMDRTNYDKFFEVMRNENSCYKLLSYKNNDNYYFPFYKLVDTRTVLTENYAKPIDDMGVFMDIFPIDGLPNDKKLQKKNYRKILYEKKLLRTKFSSSKNILKLFIKKMLSIFVNRERLLDEIDALAKKYPIENSLLVQDVTWGTKPFDKSVYDELVETEFRNHKFFVPKKYDLYLKTIYGDYMALPPESDRITHDLDAYWRDKDE